MEDWVYADMPVLIKEILSILVIFSMIIFITRISGLQTLAKMSSFDFAANIIIGSILASVIMGSEQSLLKGSIALVSIVLFQTSFAFVVITLLLKENNSLRPWSILNINKCQNQRTVHFTEKRSLSYQ